MNPELTESQIDDILSYRYFRGWQKLNGRTFTPADYERHLKACTESYISFVYKKYGDELSHSHVRKRFTFRGMLEIMYEDASKRKDNHIIAEYVPKTIIGDTW